MPDERRTLTRLRRVDAGTALEASLCLAHIERGAINLLCTRPLATCCCGPCALLCCLTVVVVVVIGVAVVVGAHATHAGRDDVGRLECLEAGGVLRGREEARC
jgi:hypothetical protein